MRTGQLVDEPVVQSQFNAFARHVAEEPPE